VWETTLELPSGHVEPTQTPEEAARTELLEETGHEAERFELVGDFSPDTGRLGNRMWCFFAGEAHLTLQTTYQPEPGIELVRFRGKLSDLLRERGFYSALNSAALFAAVLKGKLRI
jgi:8-oxo-dGTP pyrophosphatase MutT (NUDIX family)